MAERRHPAMAVRLAGATARAAIPVAVFLLLLALAVALFSRPVENFARDLAMSTISPFTEASEDIVIVAITEETLAEFSYRSPIDRGFLAGLVRRIAAAGPRSIGLDILFDQPTEEAKDEALQATIAATVAAGTPVIIASALRQDGLTPAQIDYLAEFAPQATRGLANLRRDPFDAVVRGRFAGRHDDGAWRPGFAAALAQSAGVDVPRADAPMVYYRNEDSEPFAFPTYPAQIANVLPPQWFAGKHVLIGADLPIEDRHATPFIVPNGVVAGTLPGIEIHAHLLAQFLAGDAVIERGTGALTVMIALLCLAAALLCWLPLPILAKPLIVAAILSAYWTGAAFAFSRWGLALPVAAPGALIGGVAFLTAFLAWKLDDDRRRFIESAFGRYVSPAVVKRIVNDPSMLKLGGEKRLVTCIFTDLQGFTQLSEQRQPEEMAAILNDYLDRICDLFIEHGATIDKVIGDAAVGFFGAPARQDDDAAMAVGLALAVDRFSQDHRAQLAESGIEIGVTRVGVHRGHAIVGNFGGERFFDYTAIGDTVNTAARLEGANRYFGTRLCVSAAVALSATECCFRPVGTVVLKGKSEGIEAFEPIDPEVCENAWYDAYRCAYDLMQREDSAAIRSLQELLERWPDDRLAAFHHDRLSRGEVGTTIILGEK